ncbi:hypothetical protein GCM10010357_08410 [Streptomyces luteireticuli]|uniref:Uncharacterized protein n=1 Tax=Streptomyces luteireticuli TaxID=173858 RepID=A0ABN0YC14_9ACTN
MGGVGLVLAPGPPFHRFFRGLRPLGPAPRLRRGRAGAAPPAPPLPGLRPWPPSVAAPPLVLKRRTGWIGAPLQPVRRLRTPPEGRMGSGVSPEETVKGRDRGKNHPTYPPHNLRHTTRAA